ncbi:MAG TPA: MlaD family protein [Polyangiaceae bacterium]|jgi:phospholipid/cholesterol/gamma-HCH transport system substrate-binding protein|nr:MlaD family protein [Polyangiaceae bacterium]
MGRFTTAAKVGVFAFVTLVAGLLIYRFVSKSSRSGGGYVVYALMSDASGVAKLSQVRIAGIPVGSVKSVKLDHELARIDVGIDPDVHLYQDAAIAKVSSSLLGEYYLSITPGTEGRPELKDGDRINTVVEAKTTDDIMKQVSDIAADVKQVSQALAASIGTSEGKDDIKSTLKNLADVTDALNQTVRENRESIKDILSNVQVMTATGGPKVQQILDDVRTTTTQVKQLMAQAPEGQPKSQGEIRQIIDRVNHASENLDHTLKNLDEVTGRLDRGEGTLGRLSKDDHLINEVEGVADDVGEFVGGLSRIQTIITMRTDYQFLSNTVKSYVELRIQPSEDKYYSIEVVNDPRGLTHFEQIDVDSTNPNDPPHYREVETITENSLLFSLQFAQSFGPFTGRFGIKESTGGLGLDTLLFDKRFEIRQDLFGFGEVVLPRWRVSLGYEFVNRVSLLGGVDDILSSSRRDYFVGLQLRFNDEDLKSILPFAPKAP